MNNFIFEDDQWHRHEVVIWDSKVNETSCPLG